MKVDDQAWRILLVDDDQDEFFITYGMLHASRNRDIRVDWRSSYRNGLQALEDGTPYDAALIDYDLGERTGIDFIRDAIGRGCLTPLILYTGRGSYEVDREAAQAGATLYLTKNEATPLLMERLIRYAIEHKQSEMALAQANQELENFALAASHDLKDLQRKIEAFGERLTGRNGERLDAAESDDLQRILSSAHCMRAMIDSLLTLLRVSQQEVKAQSLDLNQVAQAVIDLMDERIRQCQGQVQVGPLPTVRADPLQMQLLLQNLISNAVKFHQPGVNPLVRVYSTAQEAGQVEVVVEDNGIGINANGIARLFQPFSRLNERDKYEGSGLGLSICRKITERHGGSIAVESQEGKGSKFMVRMPV